MSTNGKHANDAVILSAARTPIGKFNGGLTPLSAPQLGATAIRAALERAGVNAEAVNEVIMGQVVQAGAGQAPARQASLGAGIPATVGALTINKVCGSGLKAVMLGASAIRAGDSDLIVAGGMESMTNAPFLLPNARQGYRYGHQQLLDSNLQDALWDPFEEWAMGNAAEFIADEYEITRADLDDYAYRSHVKAIAAIDAGRFKAEITPVTIASRKGNVVIDTDEGPRRDTSPEALAALKPAFIPNGKVTAGNAPGMNDGGAALVIASRAYADAHGHTPLARIVAYGQAAVPPKWLFDAPSKAIPVVLQKAGWTLADLDLIELNEAFAAQTLANGRALANSGWDWGKVNVNGGAIALGHPVGASGARVLVTLLYALQHHGLKRGIASLCLGGGEAVGLAIELE